MTDVTPGYAIIRLVKRVMWSEVEVAAAVARLNEVNL